MELETVFIRAIEKGQLSHAYIFEGDMGSEKEQLAQFIVQRLNCENIQPTGQPCFQCTMCQKIAHGNFSNFIHIYPDGQSIKVEQIRQLQQELAHTGLEGTKKVCVLHQAELMTSGASNSLLKLLEEPDSDVLFILMTEQANLLLATIRSRCQLVRFPVATKEQFFKQLEEQGIRLQQAGILFYMTKQVHQAIELAKDDEFLWLQKESWKWFEQLVKSPTTAFLAVQTNVLKQLTDKKQAVLFLELVQLYCRDGLYSSLGLEKEIVLTEKRTVYQSFPKKDWVNCLESLTQAVAMVKANVGIQGVLEKIVLEFKNQ